MNDPVKVLVVDDEAELRGLLRRYLSDQGCQVRAEAHAGTVSTLLARERFDVLVLDLMMPGEDGLSLCRRLRHEGETIPILMLTARGDPVLANCWHASWPWCVVNTYWEPILGQLRTARCALARTACIWTVTVSTGTARTYR